MPNLKIYKINGNDGPGRIHADDGSSGWAIVLAENEHQARLIANKDLAGLSLDGEIEEICDCDTPKLIDRCL